MLRVFGMLCLFKLREELWWPADQPPKPKRMAAPSELEAAEGTSGLSRITTNTKKEDAKEAAKAKKMSTVAEDEAEDTQPPVPALSTNENRVGDVEAQQSHAAELAGNKPTVVV
jgi:hypothetical protein